MIEVKIRSADACTVKSETLTRGRVGAMIHFNFSEEWDGLDRVAVFSNGVTDIDVYLESDTVPVPPEMFMEAGRSVKVGVRGDHIEGDVVTVVIPTVYTLLGTVFNGTDISGNASADVTPSLAEQIMAAAGMAVETANSVREDADNGVFDGGSPTMGVSVHDEPGTPSKPQGGQRIAVQVVNPDGTVSLSSFAIWNGAKGSPGDPGYSPTVSVTDIEGGHQVAITDVDGEHTFDVMDGQSGGGGTGDHRQLENRDAANQHSIDAITGLRSVLDGKASESYVNDAVATKQDALTAGSGINITGNVISATGGGGGTSDHSQLTNRDAANQHPISAIAGLQDALDGKVGDDETVDATEIPIDQVVTSGSANLVTSGAVYSAISDAISEIDKLIGSGVIV